jgi:hypothetical protein
LDGDLQNISVDGSTTSYGPELLRFARNKIAKSGPVNRLFILEWHPSMLKSNPSEELQGSRESGKMLHKLWVQILDPPIEYFMRPVVGGGSWYERKCPLVAPVNPSGWMNREFRGSALDPKMFGAIRNRHAKLVRSTEREKAFLQLVEDLSAMGDVVVLKLPMSDSLRSPENDLQNPTLVRALQYEGVRYWDYQDWGDVEDFADANHLIGDAAIRFTQDIAHRWSEDGPSP